MMRKVLILTLLLAIATMPTAFAGVGFCRSMPCCPPHLSAHATSIQQPDCCKTSSCDEAPAAAGEYTTAKQVHQQSAAIVFVVSAIVPTIPSTAPPRVRPNITPPLTPLSLQRRIAMLSVIVV